MVLAFLQSGSHDWNCGQIHLNLFGETRTRATLSVALSTRSSGVIRRLFGTFILKEVGCERLHVQKEVSSGREPFGQGTGTRLQVDRWSLDGFKRQLGILVFPGL